MFGRSEVPGNQVVEVPIETKSRVTSNFRSSFSTAVLTPPKTTRNQIAQDLESDSLTSQNEILLATEQRLASINSPEILFTPASGCIDLTIDKAAFLKLISNRETEVLKILEGWKLKGFEFNKRFKRPKTFENIDELLAYSLVTSYKHGASKKRVRVSSELRQALENKLEDLGFGNLLKVPGGATLFGSTVAAAFGYKARLVIPDGTLPSEVIPLLKTMQQSERIKIVSNDKDINLSKVACKANERGVHFSFKLDEGELAIPDSIKKIFGKLDRGLENLVTGTKYASGFDSFPEERIKKVSEGCEFAFVSGLHSVENAVERDKYLREVSIVAKAGTMTSFSYSDPKSFDAEPLNLLKLAASGMIDFFSINASEAYRLVSRICRDRRWREALIEQFGPEEGKNLLELAQHMKADALKRRRTNDLKIKRDEEHPEVVYGCARILQKIFAAGPKGGISLVRVRGRYLESVCLDPRLSKQNDLSDINSDLTKIRSTMLGARGLAATKATLDHGWFRDEKDLKAFTEKIGNRAVTTARYCQTIVTKNGAAPTSYRESFSSKDKFTKFTGNQISFFLIAPQIRKPKITVSMGDTVDAISLQALSDLKNIFLTLSQSDDRNPYALRFKERFPSSRI